MAPVRRLTAFVLLALITCTGCGGGGANTAHHLNGAVLPVAAATPTAEPGQASLPAIPAFSEQLARYRDPKSASYLPSDLLKQGEAFDPSLPHQHATAGAEGAEFEPAWIPGTPGIDGLAYAMYPFSIKGYAGDADLYFSWITPPEDPSLAYFAIANWDTKSWDWYGSNAEGKLILPSTGDYIDFGGALLVCVVTTGVNKINLDWLRLGSVPPEPQLSANPPYGLTPFSANFDASGSTDSDGTIAEYKWDPEGDGIFAQSTGTDPQLSFEYTAEGNYAAAVRVIDNDGVYQDKVVHITAVDNVNFTFGSEAGAESAHSVIINSAGQLMLFGDRRDQDNPVDLQVFVAVLSPFGTSGTAHIWGGAQYDSLSRAVPAPDGSVYACGSSNSFSLTGTGLLQKWNDQGELQWSKLVAANDYSVIFNSLLVYGGNIYVCGTLSQTDLMRHYALVCKFDLDAALVWARTAISPQSSNFTDIALYTPISIGTTSIRLCGAYDQGPGNTDCIYAAYDLDGNLLTCMTWGKPDTPEYGQSISVAGANPATYVAAQITLNGKPSIMLGRPGGTTIEISSSGISLQPTDLLGRNLVLQKGTASPSQYDFALLAFNATLALTPVLEGGAVPNGSYYPTCVFSYGSGGIGISGHQYGDLPEAGGFELDSQTSAYSWTTISPPQGTPTGLVVFAPDSEVTSPDGFEFNRQGFDDDSFVFLNR